MAMTPTLKENKKRSSSSKNVEEPNDIKIVKSDKTDHLSFPPGNMTIISADSRY